MERKAFLDQEPPPGYVAGVGRGAVGFTTSATSSGILSTLGNDYNNGNGSIEINSSDKEDDPETHWTLATSTSKDDDDQMADRIYELIDSKMGVFKHSGSTNEDNYITVDRLSMVSGGLTADFANLKRGLAGVTVEQWALLPEAGDMTRRNKRTRLLEKLQQRFYAAPDVLLASDRPKEDTSATNFELISSAKDALLSRHLDSLVPTATTPNTTVQDYNDAIREVESESRIAIADLEKSRLALASLRRVEPYKAESWIASARLELEMKEYKRAKSLIIEGCERVPRSEDVWLESIRIHQNSFETNKLCKRIVATALSILPTSSKLWLKSVDLENSSDIFAKKRVVQKALLSLPHNGSLWKRLIELEDDTTTVRMLLKKAIEMVPQEWDFRQRLIELSDYEDARKVLNSALKTMKDDYRVWITAIKIEESEKGTSVNVNKLEKMILKGITQQSLAHLDLRFWLNEAAKLSHEEGYHESTKAIVFSALESKGDLVEWLSEAEEFSNLNETQVVQLVYEFISGKQPDNEEGWIRLLNILKNGSQQNRLFEYYHKALKALPQNESLVIMFAMDTWKINDDVEGAKKILQDANSKFESQRIQLQRIELESSIRNYDGLQSVFEELVTLSNATANIWDKYIQFARFYWRNNTNYEMEIVGLIDRGLKAFPKYHQLYLQKGTMFLQEIKDISKARDAYTIGTKECPESSELWISLAELEIHQKAIIRARSILDLAMVKNPNSPELWTEKIRLERSLNDVVSARTLANKALQLFNLSPIVWKEYVELIPKKSHQKNVLNDALKATKNSSIILVMIGKLLWTTNKLDNAKVWFERAVKSDQLNGDGWGWLYAYYEKSGGADRQQFLSDFDDIKESIDKGEHWLQVKSSINNFELDQLEILKLVSQLVLNTIQS